MHQQFLLSFIYVSLLSLALQLAWPPMSYAALQNTAILTTSTKSTKQLKNMPRKHHAKSSTSKHPSDTQPSARRSVKSGLRATSIKKSPKEPLPKHILLETAADLKSLHRALLQPESAHPAANSAHRHLSAQHLSGNIAEDPHQRLWSKSQPYLMPALLHMPEKHPFLENNYQHFLAQSAVMDHLGYMTRRQEMDEKFSHLRHRFDIPMTSHPLVEMYIHYFTHKGRGFFQNWLERSERYAPLMQAILKKHRLPEDLIYLAMVESGFSANALSSAKAMGFWQFMPSTALAIGLQRNPWIDERKDFVRSTEAAAKHLKYLYGVLGDWHLAWASYNAGLHRMQKAMSKYHTRDFWKLIDYPESIAIETKHYVPKIIAAAYIAKHRQEFEFLSKDPCQKQFSYSELLAPPATSLEALAYYLKIQPNLLKELNPALLRNITPPYYRTKIRLPQHLAQQAAGFFQLPARQRLGVSLNTQPSKTNKELNSTIQHVVSPGDTLWSIAQNYGVSVSLIKTINGKQNHHLRVGERLYLFQG